MIPTLFTFDDKDKTKIMMTMTIITMLYRAGLICWWWQPNPPLTSLATASAATPTGPAGWARTGPPPPGAPGCPGTPSGKEERDILQTFNE